MLTLIPIVPTDLLGSVAVGPQSPLASMISQRFGMLECIFSSDWLAVR